MQQRELIFAIANDGVPNTIERIISDFISTINGLQIGKGAFSNINRFGAFAYFVLAPVFILTINVKL